MISVVLSVYFEDPFWVGVVERTEGGRLSACRIVFGAEPRDYEIYAKLSAGYYRLKFSPEIKADVQKTVTNPKRRLREAARQTAASGTGTKSQQALQLMREQNKTERKKRTSEEREEEAKWLFELKRQKKKEKHRGR